MVHWNGTKEGATAVMLMNVDLVDSWVAKAAAQGAQIVVFPEELISSFGYMSIDLFSIELPPARVVHRARVL